MRMVRLHEGACAAVVVLALHAPVAARAQPRAIAPADAGESPVTYARHVARILDERCAGCHRPDGPAPFSLLTFDDAKRRASLIAGVVRSRYMPPWKPEAGAGEFVGSRRLADSEVAIIERWVADGAGEGDPRDRPPAPVFVPGWQHGKPDVVIELPEYTLRSEGLDVFRNFVVRIPGSGTRFVRGLEFRPGSAAIHHANIRLDYTPASRRMDDADPGPGYEGLILHSADYPDGHFLGWTPGQFAPLAPKGLAWRLNEGGDFVVQLHMRPTGKSERIAPAIGLYLTDDAPTELPAMLRLGRQNIDVAPGLPSYHSVDSYTLPVDVQVQAVQPHSHYRAREVRASAVLPDRRSRPIISIPRWDFAWQDVYRVAEPYWLPAGTRITTDYVLDNSPANPRNPVTPPARAVWGFKSSDEMADVWIQVLTRTPADRARLVADFAAKSTAEDIVGYEMQLTQSPDNLPLHNDVALLYLELGRTRDAMRHFETVAEKAPSSAQAHFNLGTTLERLGRAADAAAHYQRAVDLDPAYAAARVNLGNLRLSQGRPADAAAQYAAALAVAPDDFGAHNNLGRLLLNDGRAADAAPHIEAALRVNPSHPEAHFNMAECFVLQHRPGEALTHYREAIRLRPGWEPSLVGLSWVLSSSADAALRAPGEALQLASAAVGLSRRGNPLSLDALAAAYARAGRFDDAVSSAHEALALAARASAPDLVAAIHHRLALYEQHQPYTAAER